MITTIDISYYLEYHIPITQAFVVGWVDTPLYENIGLGFITTFFTRHFILVWGSWRAKAIIRTIFAEWWMPSTGLRKMLTNRWPTGFATSHHLREFPEFFYASMLAAGDALNVC